MINPKDISVIVQGGINAKETPLCLKSIRKYLPEAEIILSTWEGADVSELDYDVLILNKDPGAQSYLQNGKYYYNNINRQLLSTQEGLKRAKRTYSMKLRSDLILTGNKFLEQFDKFQKRSGNYNLFKRKILVPALFTKHTFRYNKHTLYPIPFHISDWWFFGLTEDLKEYFLQTELVKEPEFTEYFNFNNKVSPYGDIKFKFAPEQYYGYSCFARNFSNIFMQDASDFNDKIIEIARECIVNNFIVLDFKHSGIYLKKYWYSRDEKGAGEQYLDLYCFYKYEYEYKKFCDSNYQITDNEQKLFSNNDYALDYLRMYKHLVRVTDPTKSILTRIEQLCLGLPLSAIKFIIRHFREIIN